MTEPLHMPAEAGQTEDFVEAKLENVNTLVAISGPSGCGKTLSALLIAAGITNDQPNQIGFVDTEARRALHYAKQFHFLHSDMRPPFTPQRFIEKIDKAEQMGLRVVIFDSFSHSHDGEGGLLEMAEEELRKNPRLKEPSNWIKPKEQNRRMINRFLKARLHLIFCLRADEKIRIEKREIDGRQKTVIVPLGWQPIAEKRFIYEMTASFLMTAENPGIPDLRYPHKIQNQHRPFFASGAHIDRNSGQLLAAWARGDAVPQMATSQSTAQLGDTSASVIDVSPLIEEGKDASSRGTVILEIFWKRLKKEERQALAAYLLTWKKTAMQVDQAAAGEQPDPDDDISHIGA